MLLLINFIHVFLNTAQINATNKQSFFIPMSALFNRLINNAVVLSKHPVMTVF